MTTMPAPTPLSLYGIQAKAALNNSTIEWTLDMIQAEFVNAVQTRSFHRIALSECEADRAKIHPEARKHSDAIEFWNELIDALLDRRLQMKGKS